MHCVVEEKINKLNIDNKIREKLEIKNIKLIKDLWMLKRKDLKSLGFTDNEINHIRIKLQLLGLDLGKKKYI